MFLLLFLEYTHMYMNNEIQGIQNILYLASYRGKINLLTGNNLALNVWEKWKINLLTGNNLALNVWEK